jgi:hypothetical protein
MLYCKAGTPDLAVWQDSRVYIGSLVKRVIKKSCSACYTNVVFLWYGGQQSHD